MEFEPVHVGGVSLTASCSRVDVAAAGLLGGGRRDEGFFRFRSQSHRRARRPTSVPGVGPASGSSVIVGSPSTAAAVLGRRRVAVPGAGILGQGRVAVARALVGRCHGLGDRDGLHRGLGAGFRCCIPARPQALPVVASSAVPAAPISCELDAAVRLAPPLRSRCRRWDGAGFAVALGGQCADQHRAPLQAKQHRLGPAWLSASCCPRGPARRYGPRSPSVCRGRGAARPPAPPSCRAHPPRSRPPGAKVIFFLASAAFRSSPRIPRVVGRSAAGLSFSS